MSDYIQYEEEKIDDYERAMLFMKQYSNSLALKLENLAKYLEEDGCEDLHAEYIKTINEAQEFIKNMWKLYSDQEEQVKYSIKIIERQKKFSEASNTSRKVLYCLMAVSFIIFTFIFFLEMK